MNATLRLLAVTAVVCSAGISRADSGTVWSLGPGGQAQGQIGRWEQQGDRVRFQWAASSQGFDVQF
ncbi:MAG TPA: hypothetical protein VFB80_21720, partial [Pirellulaceae bacterium]|nr:hypothetical protein [Pirellulaceae bacterium]